MKPRLALALLVFLALVALMASLFDGKHSAEAGFGLSSTDSDLATSLPVDTPIADAGDLADDPWPRQELLIAQQERQRALEEVGRALERARAGAKPR
jgi:hypothetical protein